MAIKVEVLQLGDSAPTFAGGRDGVYHTAVYISATSWAEDVEDTAAVLSRQSKECREYLREHKELKKVETYADRNSVRDCEREWRRLLDDAECRRFDTVLTSSLRYISDSFSPACATVGRFFYPAGIRFIAIEDGFDSMKDDMKEYLERCASMQSSYIGSKWVSDRFENQKIYKAAVPYGYRYVKDGNPQIVIDPETALYVVRLFEMAINKTPVIDMVRYMNDCKAPTPSDRRRQLYGEKGMGSSEWKQAVVKNILKNPCYVGDYVVGRTRETRTNDTEPKYEKLPPEKWKVIRNYHEPVISREMYQQSLEIMKERSFVQSVADRNYQNPYRNIFICGHCGSTMTCRIAGSKNGKDYASIICESGVSQKDGGCKTYDVKQDEVIDRMQGALAEEIRLARYIHKSLPAVTASKGYKDVLLRFDDEKIWIQSKIESSSENGEKADALYGDLKKAMSEKAQFEELFSSENPWIKLFATMDENNLSEFDRRFVKAIFTKVEIFRDGHIVPHFANEDKKLKLKEYWTKIQKEGDVPQWEEETVK